MTALLPGLIVGILCLGGILAAVLPLRVRGLAILALVAGLAAGVLSVWLAVQVWLTGPVEVTWLDRLPMGLPASLSLRADALAALFLCILGIVPAASLLFSVDYLEGETTGSARRYLAAFLFLVAGMQLVVMAADWVLFLFAWECMNLAAYLLVAHRWQEEANPRAAWVYLVTTHVASGGILLGACALSVMAGDFSVAGTTQALQQLFAQNQGLANLLVALFAVGFAAKGALFPLSFWLPGAYAAAPSPVSAVLSGVMAKMGIYGLIRLFLFMLPGGGRDALLWGLLLATLGTLNMVIGNIRSLGEQHAKRLVAQSSIGQIGYIVLGLGMAVALSGREPLLAAVALAGCLFHIVNHAAFKSLLFLTTGVIGRRAGTHDLRRLGGLIAALPVTAGMTLLAALAIAGTPPLNGFASKWLLYRASVFGGLELPVLAVYGVIAIFISTVSLAAYLKYFGTVFLGAEPDGIGRSAPTPAGSMKAAMWLLGAACVALGLWPAPVVEASLRSLAASSSAALYGVGQVTAAELMGSVLGGAGYQPLAVLGALALCGVLVWLIARLGSPEARATRPWFGGADLSPAEARYGAAHLYLPFLQTYAGLLRTWLDPRFKPPAWLAQAIDLDRWIYGPALKAGDALAGLASRVHRGRTVRYVAWQLAAVAVVVAILLVAEGGVRG